MTIHDIAGRCRRTALLLFGMAATAALAIGGAAAEAPVKLTVGLGPASDVTLYLIKLEPAIARNIGKAYTLDLKEFRGVDMRYRAFLAGDLDGSTGSANAVVDAASKGIAFTVVASVSKEAGKHFHTSYMVLDHSTIHTLADLKGKVIGINAARSSIELWARLAVEKAGLNPDRDARYTIVGFPEQGQALRSGEIDVGAFPQPFAAIEEGKGGVRVLFTSGDVVPFDEEVQLLFFRPDVLKQHAAAVRALLADLAAVTRFYVEKPREARQALLDAKVIRLTPALYFAMRDYYRSPDLEVDISGLVKMQDMQIKAGYQDKPADIRKLVDLSYLPH